VLPTLKEPMAATQVARAFHREGWVYEEKVDGWRMLAYKVAGTIKLVSRNGRDHTSRFPGIVAALRKLDATGLILDGEVAVYDAQLVSRFEWLRHASPPVLDEQDMVLPVRRLADDGLKASLGDTPASRSAFSLGPAGAGRSGPSGRPGAPPGVARELDGHLLGPAAGR